jgi:signal transduction histidine kinase
MRRRHSLRLRVTLAFAGLGALLSFLLTVGVWFAAHDVSQRLMDQTLKAELDDYMARRARNPLSLPPDTAGLRGYQTLAGQSDDHLPAPLRTLPPGLHEIDIDGVPYRIAVAEREGERSLILFSEEHQRLREHRFLAYLIAGAISMTLCAAIGGHWLAGRVIAPVTELAHAISTAPADSPPRLAVAGEPDDEIAELAGCFDRYLERLAAFVERERSFVADASHELRTPLAVIRGAAEVLAGEDGLSAAQAGRIDRIERAAAEMSKLIDALLLLAREEATAVEEPCDAVRVVRSCIDRYQPSARQHGGTIRLDAPQDVGLPIHGPLFAVVVSNLLHNAIVHAGPGDILIRIDPARMTVHDSGSGIGEAEIGRVFERYHRGPGSHGAGIGLALVKRICDRHGWPIEMNSGNGGTTVTLRFRT